MAYKIAHVEPNQDETQFDPHEPRIFTVLFASKDPKGNNIDLLANEKETKSAQMFKLYLKVWDDESKAYKDDADRVEATEKLIESTFGIKGDKEGNASAIDKLLDNAATGKEFTGYTNGESARFEPFDNYVRWDFVDPRAAKELRTYDGEFKPVPVTVNKGGQKPRFNVGFEADLKDGPKKFRVSQLIIDTDEEGTEEDLGLKFEDKSVKNMVDQLNDDNRPLTGTMLDAALEALVSLVDNAHKNRSRILKEKTGLDFDEMAEKSESPVFDRVDVINIPNSKNYYLKGHLASEDE